MRPIEELCYRIGAVLIVSGVVHVGVFLLDGGPWAGPVSWRKPITFGLSLGVSLMSVAWVAAYLMLPEPVRTLLLGVFRLPVRA